MANLISMIRSKLAANHFFGFNNNSKKIELDYNKTLENADDVDLIDKDGNVINGKMLSARTLQITKNIGAILKDDSITEAFEKTFQSQYKVKSYTSGSDTAGSLEEKIIGSQTNSISITEGKLKINSSLVSTPDVGLPILRQDFKVRGVKAGNNISLAVDSSGDNFIISSSGGSGSSSYQPVSYTAIATDSDVTNLNEGEFFLSDIQSSSGFITFSKYLKDSEDIYTLFEDNLSTAKEIVFVSTDGKRIIFNDLSIVDNTSDYIKLGGGISGNNNITAGEIYNFIIFSDTSNTSNNSIKQYVNYYNLGQDIINNNGGAPIISAKIDNISTVYQNGTGWIMKNPNGNYLTDVPTIANRSFSDSLCPVVPLSNNSTIKELTLRTGNCRVVDTNRNDKNGVAYIELCIFELDNTSIVSSNHNLKYKINLYDTYGGGNNAVVGGDHTSNEFVILKASETDLSEIILENHKQYGFALSGTNDNNEPQSLNQIKLIDTAILTVRYDGEVE